MHNPYETIRDIIHEMEAGTGANMPISCERADAILRDYAHRLREALAFERAVHGKILSMLAHTSRKWQTVYASLNDEVAPVEREYYGEPDGGNSPTHNASMQTNPIQSVTDCNQVGNTAKMRKALEQVKLIAECTSGLQFADNDKLRDIAQTAEAALAAPPRNCDVYKTVEELVYAMKDFCDNRVKLGFGCKECPLWAPVGGCAIAFAYDAYEGESK